MLPSLTIKIPVYSWQVNFLSQLYHYDSLIAGNNQWKPKAKQSHATNWIPNVFCQETWQLTCFLIMFYKHLVNIKANKPLLSNTSTYSVVFPQIWDRSSSSWLPKIKHDMNTEFKGLLRDYLKVPLGSCINHAIIINAYSEKLNRTASLWEIGGDETVTKPSWL